MKVTRLPVKVKSIGTARAADPDAASPRNAVPASKSSFILVQNFDREADERS